jgi:hypothetical protein
MINKIINKLFKKDLKLSFDTIKQFKLRNCYDCGKEINPESCWQRFVEINGEQYRVNICDDCSNKISRTSAYEDIDIKYYYGWYITELANKLDQDEELDAKMTIEEFCKLYAKEIQELKS